MKRYCKNFQFESLLVEFMNDTPDNCKIVYDSDGGWYSLFYFKCYE